MGEPAGSATAPSSAPASSLSCARVGVDRHAWDGMLAGWHVVFGMFVVLTAVLVAVDQAVGAAMRAGAVSLLLALGGWYVLGARAMRRRSPRLGAVYIVGAAAGVITLFAVTPIGSLMLFILFPQIWALLEPRRAVVGTVGVMTAVSVVWLADDDQYGTDLGAVVVYGIAGLLTALLLGLWITRVIEQSTRRADLLVELRATRAELAAASHEAGVLAERERLARDIHDTLAQGFTSILLLLDALEDELPAGGGPAARRHLDLIRGSARDNLAEARALVTAATPVDLRGLPLPEAVVRLAERVSDETGIVARHEVSGRPRALPVRAEVVLLRAAQEALSNVRKHARATEVLVRLNYAGEAVDLEVRDNGVGFDPDAEACREPHGGSGFGLAGMRRRVEQAGGSLRVHSAARTGTEPGEGTGTAVVVRLLGRDDPEEIGRDAPEEIRGDAPKEISRDDPEESGIRRFEGEGDRG